MPSASPAQPPAADPLSAEFRRADAARNVHRIAEVAARLLGDDPNVGMAEVAAAAEVSRATVYRHFATREVLLDAIRRQAVEQAEQAVVRCGLEEGSATDALRRLVTAWLEIADRYSLVQIVDLRPSPESREHGRRLLREPLLALIARGQAAGEFGTGLPPEWAARTFGALVLAGARAVSDGSLPRAQAPDVVFRTLLQGLRA